MSRPTLPLVPQLPLLTSSLARWHVRPPEGWVRTRVPFAPYGTAEIVLHPSVAHYSPTYLIHMAFLAELLAQLLAEWPDATWELPASRPAEGVPDAILHRERQRWAVEVDLSYSRAKILRKARYYRLAYDGQVWGTTTRRRERDLRAAAWPKPLCVKILAPEEVLS